MLKKALLGCGGLFVLLIVIITIAAAANGGTNSSPHKVSTSSSSRTTTTPTQQADFKVGDTIAIQGQTLKINSVNLNYMPSNEFEQPASRHQYVLVNVTLHNNGSSSVDYSSADFKIQDSQGGQTTSNAITSDSNELSSYASLAPNGTASGDIIYDVQSANASKLKLIFQPSFWNNESATIDLN